ncbi:MAG: XRE family transcriptional regulator [Candidatus Gastranaerophilales bacterium]|nr:XRE family transcriptional regulator [Candidatus Gastranaerophilales bacterium]
MFTPSRLTFARKRRGLTKAELAKSVGLSSQAISNFESENHKDTPADKTLSEIANALNFPINFFHGPKVNEISIEAASFRALSKMTAAQRNSALAAGQLAYLLNGWIEEKFDLPNHNLPHYRDETAQSAATKLRQEWQLGERPIANIIHLLESKGIRVYSLVEDSLNVDAFSCWDDGTPFIFLNTLKSSEHSRFDAAHELGHLILHRHGVPRSQQSEKDANSFASAFLMPEASVRALCPYMPTLHNLIQLKHQWIVSVAALVYRLKDLQLLTEWQHRMLVIELAQKGYTKKEPEPAEKETSQILTKVFNALKEDNINKDDIAKDLMISKIELEKLVFGLPLVGISGGNKGESQKSKADLKPV